jgi:organic radical activating enzyme
MAGRSVHVETNGSLPVPDNVDWVTCSPKTPPYKVQRIDELKIVYRTEIDPEQIAKELPPAQVHYLQPLSGLNTMQTVQYILQHPRWRLSLQTHKLINIH